MVSFIRQFRAGPWNLSKSQQDEYKHKTSSTSVRQGDLGSNEHLQPWFKSRVNLPSVPNPPITSRRIQRHRYIWLRNAWALASNTTARDCWRRQYRGTGAAESRSTIRTWSVIWRSVRINKMSLHEFMDDNLDAFDLLAKGGWATFYINE